MSRAREVGNLGSVVTVDDGNVGIGTDSPQRPLHVLGADGAGEGTPTTNSNTVAIFQNNGASSDGAIVSIIAGSNASGFLAFGDADDDIRQAIVADMADDSLDFRTGNNASAMRITSNREVLVNGTVDSMGITNIATAASGLSIQSTGAAGLKLFRNDTSIISGNVIGGVSWYGNDTTSNTPTGLAYIVAEASGTHGAGDNPTDIVFGTTPDGSETVTEAARFNSSGNLVFPNGQGIDFSASAGGGATSSILDDYEEGTWTPVIADASSGGNTGSASVTNAIYTKIGRQVTIAATINNIVTTGMTSGNTLYVRGLPFVSRGDQQTIGSARTESITYPSGRTMVTPNLGLADSWTTFSTSGSGVTDIALDVGDLTSGSADIVFTVTYFTA